jgi:hypothetical protein
MSYLKERVAYLKGLVEGMDLDVSTNEGKLLVEIIEVLRDMALAVEDIEESQEEIIDQVDDIDEDLAEIERLVFDDAECDEFGDVYVGTLECPNCSEKVDVYESMLHDPSGTTLECPYCHKDIEVEWECSCEECEDNEEKKEEE